jgi:sugar O-acyltransferase (sialic acid O-acetyltransferase NeuD family)
VKTPRADIQRVVIIGAGGHGREALDVVDALNRQRRRYEPLGFVVEEGFGAAGAMVNELPILGGFDWLGAHAAEVVTVCAVGAPEVRLRLAEKARAAGARFCTLVHPSVSRTRHVTLGEGVVIAAGAALTNRIQIGHHVHVNLHCSISHDCVIGDYAYLAPGARATGRVTLGEGCYVGAGAIIADGRKVGAWSTVGAGAVVIDDVPVNATVVGVPARVIKTKSEGWHLPADRP